MARNLDADTITELEASACRPVFLVEINFSASILRLASSNVDLSWDSKTWLGNGWLQQVVAAPEVANIEATGAEVLLAGVPPQLVSLVLSQTQQGKAVKIYLAFLDAAGAVIDDPYEIFRGKVDVPTINEAPEEPTIRITCESVLVDLDRARGGRYTKENQRINYPDDKGFDFVGAAERWTGFWGKQQNKT